MNTFKGVFKQLLLFSLIFSFSSTFGQEGRDIIANSGNNTNTSFLVLKAFLVDLEKEFDVHFLYETGLLDGVQIAPFKVRPFRGVEHNLKKTLAKTGLEYVKVTETTYVIIRSRKTGVLYGKVFEKSNQPLIGATIKVAGKNIGSISNLNGRYKLRLRPGNYKLEISYVGYKTIERDISISPKDSLPLNFRMIDYNSLEEVVIVGSRFSEISLLEKTTPTDVFNNEQIEGSPHQAITQLLQFAAPSFHSTVQNIADGTDHMDPASLRGLGPDQLLVLVNGKRRHPSALVNINGTVGRGTVATDLNAIPTASIKRIEVLRDGAASNYGSDAIAGVMNIVLKENTNFLDLNSQLGITQQGDGLATQTNANYGTGLGNKDGWINLTLDVTRRLAYNRSGNYSGPIFGDSRDNNPDSILQFFDQTGYKDQRVLNMGAAALFNASLMLNAEIPASEKLTFYFFGGASYKQGESTGFYRFPRQKTRQAGISPFGFSPQLHSDIFDRSFSVGIRTRNQPWQFDLSNTSGGNTFGFTVKNSNNASLGNASPTRARAGGFSYTQNVTNLDVKKEFQTAVPINLGFGTELRIENFQQEAGEEASWIDGGATLPDGTPKEIGIQMFPGFTRDNEVNQYRYNLGIYTSLDADLSEQFRISGAARYEFYSDFGSNFNYKISGRYKLNEFIALRSSFNTGFRAPSLHQIYFSSRATQFETFGNEQVGKDVAHFNNENITTKLFGFNDLEPETSRNFSLGIAAQPINNLSLTLDYYNILIDNRIVITGKFEAGDDPRFAEILEPVNISSAQFFTNAIDTKTQGVDFSFNYLINLNESTLKLRAAANFTETLLAEDANGNPVIRTPELLNDFQDILFNREEISRIEVAQPSNKIIFGGHFQTEKWESSLTFSRFGKVEYIHPDDGDQENWVVNQFTGNFESRDQIFNPKIITDLSFQYNFENNISIKLGGNNIFNVFPDEHLHSANMGSGIFTYSRRVQQFGLRGAFWYGKINLRF